MTSPGEVLNGRYRLERRLGGGTMGTVWEAFDLHLERTVAVKELIPGPFADEDVATRRERVKREATALAQVEHPVIVTVHDHGLQACHTSRTRVYHRDVKPGNIVVGPDGSVHLVDFGIARIVGKVPLTDDRAIVGTPEFLAPELLDGEPAGPGTDLWALDVTLSQEATGRPPRRGHGLGRPARCLQPAGPAKQLPVPDKSAGTARTPKANRPAGPNRGTIRPAGADPGADRRRNAHRQGGR